MPEPVDAAAAQRLEGLYGLELDPHYCDVILERVATAVGADAVHVASGKPFTTIARERAAESAADSPQTEPSRASVMMESNDDR